MTNDKARKKSQVFQAVVAGAGILLWVVTARVLIWEYDLRDQIVVFALVPVVIVTGLFPQHFRVPSGLKFTQNKLTFTPVDAVVLIVACWHGLSAAVFVAGIEGFTSSRRTVKRLSSNLFSSGMMALGAAGATLVLICVLRYGFGEAKSGRNLNFLAAAVALLAASLVQIGINIGLLATLFALRQANSVIDHLRDFLWTVPMFLPTGTAASLIYLALRFDILVMLVLGGPILITIYFSHRQYRDSVQKRISIMEKAHRETIEALAVAINAKDEVTHEHVLRVQIYAAGVARLLGCSTAEIEALKAGALLHDIGKIAVPDYILNKPGKLTAAEFEKMKLHTVAGAQIVARVEFPYPVVPVVRHHHERWDGKGYPDGLAGEAIPLTARILSVVDCFDAVREDRQYRRGMSRNEAIDLIILGSGTQYDPHVVSTFLAHLAEFEKAIDERRRLPLPTFGIEPIEELSVAARNVAPGAGLADPVESAVAGDDDLSVDDLKAVCGLAQAVLARRDRDDILSTFTGKLGAMIPFDLCAVTLGTTDSGRNEVVHGVGSDSWLMNGRVVALGEGVTGWVIANRTSFRNADPKLDLPASLIGQMEAYRTLIACPIVEGSVVHGAVTVYSSKLKAYHARHQSLLEQSVALLAMALSTIPVDGIEGRMATLREVASAGTAASGGLRFNEPPMESERAS
jgi:putative nucleotidyltransferase with HDIG domain